jgi:hypothetical protein
MYTPEQAAEWLRVRGSGREPDHYLKTQCPHAESWAFNEALLLDLPVLEAEPEFASQFAEALAQIAAYLTR